MTDEAQKHAENLRRTSMLLSGCVNGDREIPRETHRTVMQCAIEHANAAAEYIESLTRERDEWKRRWHETYDREERFRDERDIFARTLDKRDGELAELRRIFDEAPHALFCPAINARGSCNCFKSRVPGPQA